MKWFDNYILKKLKQALEQPKEPAVLASQPYPPRRLDRHGMNFSVYIAENDSYVIEYSSVEHHTGRSQSRLYVITDQSQLAEKLGHIITVETLRM